MNYKMMGRLIAQILLAEAAFMVPALIISLVGQDSQAILGFALSILVILAVAGMLMFIFFFCKKSQKRLLCKRRYGLCRTRVDCNESFGLSSILDFT